MATQTLDGKIKKTPLERYAVVVILGILFFARLLLLSELGPEYSLKSDDVSYVQSGITLARTGVLTMHGTISAQIMPGLPMVIAVFAKFLGSGRALWMALKLFYCFLGTMAAAYVYRAIRLFAPAWAAVIPLFFFFTPDFLWQDNLILTETPFMFLLASSLYHLMALGRTEEWRHFYFLLLSMVGGLLLKAQFIIFPLLAFLYLAVVGYDGNKMAPQAFLTLLAFLLVLAPWTVRNYRYFHSFIPLTYGVGNPLLLGTYQGEGFPEDEPEVYGEIRQRVQGEMVEKYGDDDGALPPYIQRYALLEEDLAIARYRQEKWWREDPQSFLRSYLWLKPKSMFFKTFYWFEVIPGFKVWIEYFRQVEFYFFIFTPLLALVARKWRRQIFFLVFLYFQQIYSYAMAYVFDRYAQTLLPIRYIVVGLGLALIAQILERLRAGRKSKSIFEK
ncbi:MAG: hypothetical protein Q4E76_01715 [Tissierellia bacterium]|nr:hypothetical protein [Tissierellia bacterium]